jgi:hypothetical protein
MLQLQNRTPFAATLNVLPDREGVQTLYVVVKATFTLIPTPQVAPTQVPPVLADQPWDDGASVRYASEVHLGKPGTDVVVVGSACAPAGKRVTEQLAAVQIGERRHVARVFGDRTWKRGGGISAPAPFERVPLRWEHAFGGDGEPRNPVGRGFAGKRSVGDVVGQPLPNLEDPLDLLESFGDKRSPVGFGFVAPGWLPRRAHAGTYDERWARTQAPFLPDDFDPRFFQSAPEPLQWPAGAELGGAPVVLIGMHPEGTLRFPLPTCPLQATVLVAGERPEVSFHLETVLFEPDENRMSLSFRAAVRCDKRALRIRLVRIEGGPA